jgi:hypothetical protein
MKNHCIDVICMSCGKNYCIRCLRSYDHLGDRRKEIKAAAIANKTSLIKFRKEKCQFCGKQNLYHD